MPPRGHDHQCGFVVRDNSTHIGFGGNLYNRERRRSFLGVLMALAALWIKRTGSVLFETMITFSSHDIRHVNDKSVANTYEPPSLNLITTVPASSNGSTGSSTTSMGHLKDESHSTSTIKERYLARGPNFWFADDSGCHVATWVFGTGPEHFKMCFKMQYKRIEGREHHVKANDSIFVPYKLLPYFVRNVMYNLTAPFVLLSGQFHAIVRTDTRRKLITGKVLGYSNLLKWFVQNPTFYMVNDLDSPKLASLPFGLQKYHYNKSDTSPSPGQIFQQAFDRHNPLLPKTNGIFYGYIGDTHPLRRTMVPSSPTMVNRSDFYDLLAASRFVVSPRGDRPDCYRNYEALAFGTIPVTDLPPEHYEFFRDAPIIYNTTDWRNLTENSLLEEVGMRRFSIPNRNLVFEEYWLEYMDRVAGRSIRWSDRLTKEKVFLSDFVNYAAT